jgi:hypothetical protein
MALERTGKPLVGGIPKVQCHVQHRFVGAAQYHSRLFEPPFLDVFHHGFAHDGQEQPLVVRFREERTLGKLAYADFIRKPFLYEGN